jgi:hypothetical protein|tara:strand:+ start:300 stop:635 length:336 start_codon:yes stop_codon:yes gene_type:complete
MKIIMTIFALIAFGLSACTSTTEILTEPSGAKVYADGMTLGKSPVTYSDQKTVGSVTRIELKKEGCEDKVVTLSRNEKFDAGACLGGVLVLVPFMWIQGYNPTHTYELECN